MTSTDNRYPAEAIAPPARNRERGQATVEFALVLPILMLVLLGIFEFGDAFWKYQQLSAAASEGARTAIVSRNDADPDATVTAAVEAAAPNLDEDQLDVAVNSSWDPGDPVTVTVTYPESISIMGIEFFNSDLTSTRTMRVEQ